MMMKTRLCVAAMLCLGGMASVASANDGDVDIRSFEYLDVIETADGSVWKGVIVEQTPNVSYRVVIAGGSVHVIKAEDVVKMSKQRNREFRGMGAAAPRPVGEAAPVAGDAAGVGATYQPKSTLPEPFVKSGPRFEPEVAIVFPSGDLTPEGMASYETSFAPSIRGGYEALYGNFSIGGGGLTRFTYWMLPGETEDAHWTLETHLYGRLGMHIGRVSAFAGVSLGLDTNYIWVNAANMSDTTLGFGMNLQTGVELAATDLLGLRFGFDYHPGTDSVQFRGLDVGDVSYYALLLGLKLHL